MTYSIDAQALGEHSGRVAQCASGVHEGASAAETTIDGSAFGVLRSPIALPVGLVCGGAMIAIGHVAEELDALSRNLRTMAANYEAADPQAQRTYRATRRDYSTTLGPQ